MRNNKITSNIHRSVRGPIATLLLVIGLSAAQGCATRHSTDAERVGRVIYNLDSSEFFVGTFGPITAKTIDQFVHEHARAGVTDLFVNVNAQRTSYDSDVWEAHWEGLDPDEPEVEWMFNTGVLHEAGVDYPARMLSQARENGVRAWVSIRMNDAHLPDQPEHPLHSDFWRAHPEWHLANTGLDYEVPDVRAHYLRLIDEIAERYDVDGIELDFLRFQYYFRDGRASTGTPLMTEVVKRGRDAVRAAAGRLGHEVQLSVRVPTSPGVSAALGLDVVGWAKSGLVDLVIASPWWESANSDIRVEEWTKAVDGTGVQIAVSTEDGVSSGGVARRTLAPSEMRGIIVSALHRGADAAYFFNLFTNPLRVWSREDYFNVLRDAASLDSLARRERRHVVTITDPWAPGEPRPQALLPAEGTVLEFEIHIGPEPSGNRDAHVELVLANVGQEPVVTVNETEASFAGLQPAPHLDAIGVPEERRPPRSVYVVPHGALRDSYNTIRVESNEPVVLRWVEIRIAER